MPKYKKRADIGLEMPRRSEPKRPGINDEINDISIDDLARIARGGDPGYDQPDTCAHG